MQMVLIVLLITSLTLSACASGSGAGYAKPDVTEVQRDADAKECSHPGMLIGGALTMPVLVFPGLALMMAAGSMERDCMQKKGYTMEPRQ
jgi:hypothetical protein